MSTESRPPWCLKPRHSSDVWLTPVLFTHLFLLQGVLGRVYETVVMLILLTLLVLGMVWVASAIVDNDKASRESLYGES